ncbi:ubiquitin carboxyl-terminal hydrolase CYLD-like [Xyrichtys novacula]|uniref:Ubiquitin carboxyl-terminal hydrolase CYLD n=1 Tax=Xyrichtys novacula TaxID=13765 RepID=A0AAV1FDF8_XYRNO|nr:ubiquitin carboxyl-terminal hydrolase CYLD-like [Xyrichtys novacula]
MSSLRYKYFILLRKLEHPSHLNPGSICYMTAYKHKSTLERSPAAKFAVRFVGSLASLDYDIDVNMMEELSEEEARFLLALPEDPERLNWFKKRNALQTALTLTEGTAVIVDEDGEQLKGIIRYIGEIAYTCSSPISGTFFGIELQGADRGKGKTGGTFSYRKLFTCPKDCGVFAPFSRVRPAEPSSPSILQSSSHAETEEKLNIGDRVTYFVDDNSHHGMVVDMKQHGEELVVRISTETDENGKRGGEIEVPMHCVAKGEVSAVESMDVDTPPVEAPTDGEDLYSDLSLDSLVEVSVTTGNLYGIIRWIGNLPERPETMAGLELEEEKGVSDGTFKNERFFRCPPKRALFVKFSSCRPDSRFQCPAANHSKRSSNMGNTEAEMERDTQKSEIPIPPISTEQVNQILIGRMKGIQGHCNSCYMDAALFSLFSCSSVLDSMLFKSTEPQDAPIQNTLLYDIVNPLRRRGFVEGRHVMKLRQQLQNHGYSHSFTTDEKDPEEFLTVIMHHILALDPLLKLSSAGSKVQDSYCYQIFLDQNHSLVLPTVQQLLEHSFRSAGLKLAEAPSCLILQMPRFGKKFKMFDKIIPSLELDITALLSEGLQTCMLCGGLAQEECKDCFEDPVFSQTGFKVFCRTCSSQVLFVSLHLSHYYACIF